MASARSNSHTTSPDSELLQSTPGVPTRALAADRTATRASTTTPIRYAIKPVRWPALIYYRTDGQIEIDNNAAEHSLHTVDGTLKKGYLFAGSDAG